MTSSHPRHVLCLRTLLVAGCLLAVAGRATAADHYLCYDIRPVRGQPKFTGVKDISLLDRFGSVRFDVSQSKQICLPSAASGVGIADPITHLQPHGLKVVKNTGKPAPHPGLPIANLLGDFVADAGKPTSVLVPAAKGLGAAPPPLDASRKAGLFTCYKAKLGKTSPKPPKLDVLLTNQFTVGPPILYEVKSLKALCVPASRGGTIAGRHEYLACYGAKQSKSRCADQAPLNAGNACKKETDCGGSPGTSAFCLKQPKPAPIADVHLDNELTASRWEAGAPDTVCIATAIPECGNDVLDPGEACDGSEDAGCPGECHVDCVCPLVTDMTPPVITIDAPADGATIGTSTPVIEVAFRDAASGIAPTSYQLTLDGVDVTRTGMTTPTGAMHVLVARMTPGEHTLVARIKDRAGNAASVSAKFTVTVFRAIADCAPRTGPAPLRVAFRSRAEFTGGSIVRFRWDYECDGIYDTYDEVASDKTFLYRRPGTYCARLEVTDNTGRVAVDSCTLTVQGSPPTVSANANPSNGPVPLTVSMSGSATDADGTIVRYEWDYEGDGTFDYSSTTSASTSHLYATPGTYNAQLRVTDDDGLTATARVTTTAVRVGPPGTPTIVASASPSTGNAPLTVSLSGSGTDDGRIVRWEWDFEGDGVFDYSAATPTTTHRYVTGGIFPAALRATDDQGMTSLDVVDVTINVTPTIAILDDSIDQRTGEQAVIHTALNGGIRMSLFIKDRLGKVVRTLVANVFRPAGEYDDGWDTRDGSGSLVSEGVYFAVVEYDFAGQRRSVDLTNTTGGVRYTPTRNTLPASLSPLENELVKIDLDIPSTRGASELQLFIGLYEVDTRLVTLVDRTAFPVGKHRFTWDGIDASGKVAVPPPGNSFLVGAFAFTLPTNAILVTAAPDIASLRVDPTFFDPSTALCTATGPVVASLSFDLSKAADVVLTVAHVGSDAHIVRTQVQHRMAGSHAVTWDGRNDRGVYVDTGDYRLGLYAVDASGNQSLVHYALQRIFY